MRKKYAQLTETQQGLSSTLVDYMDQFRAEPGTELGNVEESWFKRWRSQCKAHLKGEVPRWTSSILSALALRSCGFYGWRLLNMTGQKVTPSTEEKPHWLLLRECICRGRELRQMRINLCELGNMDMGSFARLSYERKAEVVSEFVQMVGQSAAQRAANVNGLYGSAMQYRRRMRLRSFKKERSSGLITRRRREQ